MPRDQTVWRAAFHIDEYHFSGHLDLNINRQTESKHIV